MFLWVGLVQLGSYHSLKIWCEVILPLWSLPLKLNGIFILFTLLHHGHLLLLLNVLSHLENQRTWRTLHWIGEGVWRNYQPLGSHNDVWGGKQKYQNLTWAMASNFCARSLSSELRLTHDTGMTGSLSLTLFVAGKVWSWSILSEGLGSIITSLKEKQGEFGLITSPWGNIQQFMSLGPYTNP